MLILERETSSFYRHKGIVILRKSAKLSLLMLVNIGRKDIMVKGHRTDLFEMFSYS